MRPIDNSELLNLLRCLGHALEPGADPLMVEMGRQLVKTYLRVLEDAKPSSPPPPDTHITTPCLGGCGNAGCPCDGSAVPGYCYVCAKSEEAK